MFLASYLYKNGYEAKILDLSTTDKIDSYFQDFLSNNQYDIIGFTANTPSRFIAWDLIKVARLKLSQALIVVGGPHFTYTAEETLSHIPEVDIVVKGEGEITLLEIIKAREADRPFDNIQGISYRSADGIIHNPPRKCPTDIDQFTIEEDIEDNIILPAGKYSPFMWLRNLEKKGVKALSISIGRGCPGKCVFCVYNKIAYRSRSIESIIAEIKHKIGKYNCRNFHFEDVHLLKRPRFFVELCERIIRDKLDIQWCAESRADITLDLIDLAKKAGCVSIDIGLESASQKILDTIKKGITADQVQQVINRCHELGIEMHVFCMISLPGESEEDAMRTLRFLADNKEKIKKTGMSTTHIFPGTELEQTARETGMIDKDFSWYNRGYSNDSPQITPRVNVPLWLENLSKERILWFQERSWGLNNGMEWSKFAASNLIPDGSKIALYSAGSMTSEFIHFYNRLAEKPYEIAFVIDKYKQGTAEGYAVVDLEEGLRRKPEYIIITSIGFYDEIREELSARGLKEYDDFLNVYFLQYFDREARTEQNA